MEAEHYGLALLVESADPDDAQVAAWKAQLEAIENNIQAMRKGLTVPATAKRGGK